MKTLKSHDIIKAAGLPGEKLTSDFQNTKQLNSIGSD